MAKYEVVGNLLAIFTVDDDTGVVEKVHVCDGGPSFEPYMDVWEVGDKTYVSVFDPEKERIRMLVGSVDHPSSDGPFGFPPINEWEY